ncbi:MAG: hypothetical protein V4608_15880 [Bacteroidota bacterium]
MTKTFYIIIYFCLLNIISFGQTAKVIQSLDTAKLAVFYKSGSTLTQGQIKTADSILINVVNYYNAKVDKGQTPNNDTIVLSFGAADKIDIEKYCRQYTVTVFNDGSVNINAFCFCQNMVKIELINWKKTPIKIHDGGSCVFSVRLDLTTGLGQMMKVNGM